MNEQLLNIKLVQEVEKYPLLYNTKLPEYSRKDLTDKAWSKVGHAVNLPAFECKEKWRNLRAVYMRHMKPVLTGTGEMKSRPYYMAEAMKFTLPFIQIRNRTTTNLPADPLKDQNQIGNNHSQSQETTSSSSIQQPESSQSSHILLPGPLKRSSSDEEDNSAAEEFQAKKTKLCKTTTTSNKERSDRIKMFLLGLVPELEQMTNQQLRMFRRRILQTIDEVIYEEKTMSFETVFCPAPNS